MLIGIFWARIGSPTGVAEGGTVEEIERAHDAHKPIMLYFSKVGIDPEQIDIAQIEKLNEFKRRSYPKSLVETYRTQLEFKDKLTRQLDIKVRELEQIDREIKTPLILDFVSIEREEVIGNKLHLEFDHFNVTDIEKIPEEPRSKAIHLASSVIKSKAYLPIALAIRNITASGVRNIFVELEFVSDSATVEITTSPTSPIFGDNLLRLWSVDHIFGFDTDAGYSNDLKRMVAEKLAKFKSGELQKLAKGWRLAFEWEAIQPQRVRLIEPVVYVYSPVSSKITVNARIFADPFPLPLLAQATLIIDAKQVDTTLAGLVPEWESRIAKETVREKVVPPESVV